MRGEEHGPTWPNRSQLGWNLAVLGLKSGRLQRGPGLGATGAQGELAHVWTQVGFKMRNFFFGVCVGASAPKLLGPRCRSHWTPKLKPGSAHVGPRQARSDATWSCFFGLWSINSCLLLAASWRFLTPVPSSKLSQALGPGPQLVSGLTYNFCSSLRPGRGHILFPTLTLALHVAPALFSHNGADAPSAPCCRGWHRLPSLWWDSW